MTEPLRLTHPPRPGEEVDRDVRYTPAQATEALLNVHAPPHGQPVLDPAAGDGAILRVLACHKYDVESVEIRDEEMGELSPLGPCMTGDWLSVSEWYPERSIVCNPPYSIGAEFMTATLRTLRTRQPYCAALLRLNHLGSGPWFRFWREHPPSGLLVLGSFRPSFSGDGKTDASEYAWVIWDDSPHQWIEVV